MVKYYCDWCEKEHEIGQLDTWKVAISVGLGSPVSVTFTSCFSCSIKVGLRVQGDHGVRCNHQMVVNAIIAQLKQDATQQKGESNG